MSQTVTLELSGDVYPAIRRQAEAVGTSPAHWNASMLEQQYGLRDWQVARTCRTEAEQQAARERFAQHCGEVDPGYATESNTPLS